MEDWTSDLLRAHLCTHSMCTFPPSIYTMSIVPFSIAHRPERDFLFGWVLFQTLVPSSLALQFGCSFSAVSLQPYCKAQRPFNFLHGESKVIDIILPYRLNLRLIVMSLSGK